MATTYAIPDGRVAMAATTYTGTGNVVRSVTNTVNGVSFQPDFVWIKSRGQPYSHALYDSVRGTGAKSLESNTTSAEGTSSAYHNLTSFDTGGFTLGTVTGSPSILNENGVALIGWQWKAGGTAVSNTAGSITSSVSANTTAGFSVVNWTGSTSTSAQTVGHGLGVAPKMVILKNRNLADNWFVFLSGITSNSQNLYLNTTAALTTQASALWGAGMTSTVCGVRPNSFVNTSSDNVIMYCFAEVAGYSAFGSYTGNGSADGPFVYTAMRPRWIMLKRTDSASDWAMFDTSRNTYNLTNLELNANLSGAEFDTAAYRPIDILSNGFKLRGTNGGGNASGGTYIYMAFAENPTKFANAR